MQFFGIRFAAANLIVQIARVIFRVTIADGDRCAHETLTP